MKIRSNYFVLAVIHFRSDGELASHGGVGAAPFIGKFIRGIAHGRLSRTQRIARVVSPSNGPTSTHSGIFIIFMFRCSDIMGMYRFIIEV